MHRSIRLKHVALFVGIVTLAAVPTSSPVVMGQAGGNKAAKPATSWEYCQFYILEGYAFVNAEKPKSTTTIIWYGPDKSVKSETWKGLAEKMKIPLQGEKLPEGSEKLGVFNFLGSQGWELVTHCASRTRIETIIGNDGRGDAEYYYTFRRPK